MAKNDIIENLNTPIMIQDRRLSDDLCSISEEKEIIHSGHFMVSDFNDDEAETEAQDEIPAPQTPDNEEKTYCFVTAAPVHFNAMSPGYGFQFIPNAISIDSSLTRLFNCMTLAYSGKLTSPKWKTFKGLKLRWKEKIRLNNVIWRAWHIQYIKKKKPVICQFASPFDGETHNKPEAVVLEGKYWKRRLDTVCAEYKKWRIFYKEKLSQHLPDDAQGRDMDLLDRLNFHDMGYRMYQGSMSPTPQLPFDDEANLVEVLWSMAREPFMFPDPREMAQAGRAEFIQPGLVQLQPDLDDFMDTFEPFQDFFSASRFFTPSAPNGVLNESDPLRSMSGTQMGHMANTRGRTPQQPIINKISNDSESVFEGSLNQKLDTGNHMTVHAFTNDIIQSSPTMNFVSQTTSDLGSQLAQIEPYSLSNLSNSQPSLNMNRTSSNPNDTMNASLILSQGQQQFSPLTHVQSEPFRLSHQNLSESPKNNRPIRKLSAPASLRFTRQNYAYMPTNNHSPLPISQDPHKLSSSRIPSRRLSTTIVNSPPPVVAIQTQINQFPLTTSSDMISSGSNLCSSQPTLTHMFAPNNQGSTSLEGKPANVTTSTSNLAQNNVTFTLPKKSNSPRNHPQLIAPAPSPSINLSTHSQVMSVATSPPSQHGVLPQNVFLAQLLTNASSSTYTNSPNTPNKQDQMVSGDVNTSQNFVMAPLLTKVTGVNDFLLGQATPAFSNTSGSGNQVVDTVISSIPITNTSNSRIVLTPTSSPPSTIDKAITNLQNADNSSLCGIKQTRIKTEHDRMKYKEHRRVCHINSEQKRRYNIKNGFDVLHSLLPSLSQNPTAKVSKAAMLQKAVEYIKTLKSERTQMQDEMEYLKQQLDQLQLTINQCQQQLPATGVPVTRQRTDKMREMYDEYVRTRTLQNWKFWIFSIIIQPLFESYNDSISTTSSLEDLCHSAMAWIEQHCSLMVLRPAVLTSLRMLSTSTSILTDPSKLCEQAIQAVTKKEAPS